MSKRKCGRCGHDPACGHASITQGDGPEVWLCHDDECDCYSPGQTALDFFEALFRSPSQVDVETGNRL